MILRLNVIGYGLDGVWYIIAFSLNNPGGVILEVISHIINHTLQIALRNFSLIATFIGTKRDPTLKIMC